MIDIDKLFHSAIPLEQTIDNRPWWRGRFVVPLAALFILLTLIFVTALYYYFGGYNHTLQPQNVADRKTNLTNDQLKIAGTAQKSGNPTSANNSQSSSGTATPPSSSASKAPTSSGSTGSPTSTSSNSGSAGGSSTGGGSSQAPPPYTPHPLFVGDFETGNFNQWAICQTITFNDRCTNYNGTKITYSLQLENTILRQGNWAARFEVRNGDQPFCCGERSEVNGDTALTSNEGDDRWYQWSTLFAAGWPNQGWSAVAQWHDEADGPPALSFNTSTDDGFASGNWGVLIHKNSSPNNTITTYTPWQTPINPGTWHDIKIHVKWSTSDSIGFIEVWHNGARQTFSGAPCAGQTRCMTRTMTPGGGGSVYYKQGYYRDPNYTSTGVVYQDGFSMAASEADLNPL
jgi:Polysaccharide lyase